MLSLSIAAIQPLKDINPVFPDLIKRLYTHSWAYSLCQRQNLSTYLVMLVSIMYMKISALYQLHNMLHHIIFEISVSAKRIYNKTSSCCYLCTQEVPIGHHCMWKIEQLPVHGIWQRLYFRVVCCYPWGLWIPYIHHHQEIDTIL